MLLTYLMEIEKNVNGIFSVIFSGMAQSVLTFTVLVVRALCQPAVSSISHTQCHVIRPRD